MCALLHCAIATSAILSSATSAEAAAEAVVAAEAASDPSIYIIKAQRWASGDPTMTLSQLSRSHHHLVADDPP